MHLRPASSVAGFNFPISGDKTFRGRDGGLLLTMCHIKLDIFFLYMCPSKDTKNNLIIQIIYLTICHAGQNSSYPNFFCKSFPQLTPCHVDNFLPTPSHQSKIPDIMSVPQHSQTCNLRSVGVYRYWGLASVEKSP